MYRCIILAACGVCHFFNLCAESTQTIEHQTTLYLKLAQETQNHIEYLSHMGFGERAKGIQFNWFQLDQGHLDDIDLSSFERRTAIPQEVLNFDPSKKNTLITTDPQAETNKPEDLQTILDVRLYPTLRRLMTRHRIQVFLGSKQEMAAYYQSKHSKILFGFTIPSSATYYLVESEDQECIVVMAGLVGRENIVAQLLTMKLAGLNINQIEIVGEIEHFSRLVQADVANLIAQFPELKIGKHILIIAGCGLERTVSEIISREYEVQAQSFRGNIVSLTQIPLAMPVNGIHGFISLNLNYGEITEEIIRLFLNHCECKYVFTGGAGGYIPHEENETKPAIGTRIAITRSMNEQGEIVTLGKIVQENEASAMHLQIPSIFLETYEWLEGAKQRGTSVDVETFYIIRAIHNYNLENPLTPVEADCGYFVSDYVGEQALREYSRVYREYPSILSEFLRKCFSLTDRSSN